MREREGREGRGSSWGSGREETEGEGREMEEGRYWEGREGGGEEVGFRTQLSHGLSPTLQLMELGRKLKV